MRWVLLSLWAVSVVFGMTALVAHAARAGVSADAPARWPLPGAVGLDPERPTLLMLAHPRCPCTVASLDELSIAMAKLQGQVAAHVFFVEPEGVGQEWQRTRQWETAARIPGVQVHADPGGREAARFGARTSGQIVLYSPAGRLLFSGGITAARGHMGDNVGLARIISLVRAGEADRTVSSVFGCPLFDEEP